MRLTLGINNCFAAKRWPRPEEWAQIVSEELGLATVQHSLDLSDLDHALDADAQAVSAACVQAGLTIHSVFTGLIAYSTSLMLAPTRQERDRAVDYWSRTIRFASRVGAGSVGGHVGSLSRRDADDPGRRAALWGELQEHLAQLSRLARQYHLDALLVENMACDREPCLMSDVSSLLRASDPDHAAVALCLDVGHQCAPGMGGDEADPYAWCRTLGQRAPVIHLQQSDAQGDHHWPFTSAYNELGRIRGPQVLEALAASGTADATLILEVIPAFEADDRQVLDELKESVSYWQDAVRDFTRV
jgi:sugar phosphate isomerase/epimerase